jgi:hypothetical protein
MSLLHAVAQTTRTRVIARPYAAPRAQLLGSPAWLAVAALLLLVSSASAERGPKLRLRWQGEPRIALHGEVLDATLEVGATADVVLGGFRIERPADPSERFGAGHRLLASDAPGSLFLARGERVEVAFRVALDDPRERIRLCFDADGEPECRPFDRSVEGLQRAIGRALPVPRDGVAPSPPALLPDAAARAAPAPSPLAAPSAPAAPAAARAIRVHGNLSYFRPDRRTLRGAFQPDGWLGVLAGEESGGTWRLRVENAGADLAALEAWSLLVNGREPVPGAPGGQGLGIVKVGQSKSFDASVPSAGPVSLVSVVGLRLWAPAKDIRLFLVSPAGTEVTLSNGQGGDSSFEDVAFADEADLSIAFGPRLAAQGIRVNVVGRCHVSPFPVFTFSDTEHTDANGDFDFTASWPLPCDPDVWIEFEAKGRYVTVENFVWQYNYRWLTSIVSSVSGNDIDFGLLEPDDHAAAMNVVNTLTRAARWLETNRGQSPPNVNVQMPGNDSWYFALYDEILLHEDDRWSDTTMLHEYGHFWMDTYSLFPEIYALPTNPESSYCNGIGDACPQGILDGCLIMECGHFQWCEEQPANAWHEGFATWFADLVARSFTEDYGPHHAANSTEQLEWPETCIEGPSTYRDPLRTEGFLSVLLRDVEDRNVSTVPDPHEGYAPGAGLRDTLALGADEIFTVAEQDRPQTPETFLAAFRVRYPVHTTSLWETAKHAGYEIDTAPPGAPANLASSTHTPGVATRDPYLSVTWSPAADDASGIAGYAVLVSPDAPALPAESATQGEWTVWESDALPPGSWWVNVRAADRAGRWSPALGVFGPIVILPPLAAVVSYGGVTGDTRVDYGAVSASATTFDHAIPLQAGQTIGVRVLRLASQPDGSGTLDPALSLVGPTGTILASAAGGGGDEPPGPGENALLPPYTVTADGTYVVRVSGESGTVGKYRIEITTTGGPASSLDLSRGLGASWGDFDGDGDDDLFATRTNAASRLVRNDAGVFTDVTPAPLATLDAVGAGAWGDLDGDGDLDLAVPIRTGVLLLRSDGGASFADVSAALTGVPRAVSAVAWADADGDADLDLHVVSADLYGPDALFLNQGAGAFTASGDPEIRDTIAGRPGWGRRGVAAAWSDYDDDGDLDVFVANASPFAGTDPEAKRSRLLRNRGDGSFEEPPTADLHGIEATGAAWGDFNGDGHVDLVVTRGCERGVFCAGGALPGAGSLLFVNSLGSGFANITVPAVAAARGSGASFGDVDDDGDLDLFLAGSRRMFLNDGASHFSDWTDQLHPLGDTDAAAFSDFDGDGDLDLGGPTRLWRNEIASSYHWLTLRLAGLSSPSAAGARARLRVGPYTFVRDVSGGGQPLGQDAATLHWGLGLIGVPGELEVLWPSGVTTRRDGVTFDQHLSMSEPAWTLSVQGAAVGEGNSGVTQVPVVVRLAAPSDGTVSVDVRTAGGTATPGVDYDAVATRVGFPAGATEATVFVGVHGDTIPEPTESLSVELSAPTNARIASGVASISIQNDDGAPPSVSLQPSSVRVREGDAGGAEVVLTLAQSVAVPQTTSVGYEVVEETASEGSDFEITSAATTFPPGAVARSIVVTILGDRAIELDETFRIRLVPGADADVDFGHYESVITIAEDDTFQWSLPTAAATSIGAAEAGADQLLGYAVASAGDVNGDGFEDVIAGAPGVGRAYLHLGSASGTSATPAVTLSPTLCDPTRPSSFGHAVAPAGDVNGDHYADVIVGAPDCGRDLARASEGAAFVYLGGPSGLAATPHWVATGGASGRRLGWSVASAGDVNDDGAADVVVGAPFYGSETGSVFVWLGATPAGLGPSGDAASADWSVSGAPLVMRLGFSVAGVGDVNGDGHEDVAATAPLHLCVPTPPGCAHVWYGGESGATTLGPGGALTSSGVDRTLWGGTVAIARAGDVNGDGVDDVVVGTGKEARLHAGAASGLSPTAIWTATVPTSGVFGYAVAGPGDVNGDGFDDLLVGARESGGYSHVWGAGQAFLYLGAPQGATTTPVWGVDDGSDLFTQLGPQLAGGMVAGAGDVNGDGHEDLLVGSPGFTDFSSAEGAVRVYLGGETAFVAAPAALPESPDPVGWDRARSAPAGDVNGDGFDDVVALDATWTRLEVFLGALGGIAPIPLPGVPVSFDVGETPKLAAAGDVNGDGYGDVLVGVGAEFGVGRAWLYLGSRGGLLAPAAWTAQSEIPTEPDGFGYAVASAGDVNADGYDDVLVGAPFFSTAGFGGMIYEGKAYLYLGSASGLGAAPAWSFLGEQEFQGYFWGGSPPPGFGGALAAAGDVDGDGFGDVVIGAPAYDPGEQGEGIAPGGRIYVFRGHASGVATIPAWKADGEGAQQFGRSVDGAGDVDGDGFDDLVAGVFSGRRAYLWRGAQTFGVGPDETLSDADWVAGVNPEASGDAGWYFGIGVAGVGDVDGNGFDDVAVVGGGGGGVNRLYVYLGAAGGLARSPVWTAALPDYREDVAGAGDVNRDGVADVFAGGRIFLGDVGRGVAPIPFAPTVLDQRRYDGTAGVNEGSTVTAGGIQLRGTVASPSGETVRLEVELRRANEGFVGVSTHASDWLPSGSPVTLAIGGLPSGRYRWRYRTVDATGAASPWQEYARTSVADFSVNDAQGPLVALVPPALSIAWNGDAITLRGTASDVGGVLHVGWWSARGASGVAAGTTDWTAYVSPIHVGSNAITIEALDATGNVGPLTVSVIRSDAGLVTIAKEGAGAGTVTIQPGDHVCDPVCHFTRWTYGAGTPVTLGATPEPGSTFLGWLGYDDCLDGVVTPALYAPAACVARFEPAALFDATSRAWFMRETSRAPGALAVTPEGDAVVATNLASGTGAIETSRRRADGSIAWIDTFTDEHASARAATVDGAGNAIVAGTVEGDGLDFLTLRYAPDGSGRWEARWAGSATNDLVNAVAADAAGNVIVTGTSGSDWRTVAYSPTGQERWSQPEDGPAHGSDVPRAVAVDSLGRAYVVGESQSDLLIVAYDTNGAVRWRDRYDGPNGLRDAGAALALDEAHGGLVVAGESEGDFLAIRYTLGGSRRWVQRQRGTLPGGGAAAAVAIDADGNALVTGAVRGVPGTSGLTDYLTVKLDLQGHPVWARRFDGSFHGTDAATAIAVTDAGDVIVTGRSRGTFDARETATLQYDASGNERWVERERTSPFYDDDVLLGVDAASTATILAEEGQSAAARLVRYLPDLFDPDGDLVPTARDVCPYAADADQMDRGGVGAGSAPDGVGDACQCGDANGDGRVTIGDAIAITRSLLSPPTATIARPELCDVGGSAGCTIADAVILRRALLAPPTSTIGPVCEPAAP